MVGFVLVVIGVIIRIVAEKTLGKYYSYGLRILPNHKLVRYGVYKHIRHPISFAMLMYSFGASLIFTSVYGFTLMLGLIPFILYRIRIEENMLLEEFGDEYREYMKRTKKIIPFIY